MKTTAAPLPPAAAAREPLPVLDLGATESHPNELPSEVRRADTPPSRFSDVAELVKLRLSLLVLATTLLGFYLGWQGPMDWALLFHVLCGTALAAAGAAALNQWIERDWDARMRRTRHRPLPAGRMKADSALLIGFACALTGLLQLALFVSLLSAALAGVTIAVYLAAYTPLKRVSTLNTLVGAIPGAIPPMIGWAAATGGLNYGAWLLFSLMFAWQMPHFLAIAWMYRDDYAQAGYVMLPGRDPAGGSTGRQSVNYAFLTALVSLLPALVGLAGPAYFFVALVLGALLVVPAVRFQLDPTNARAKQLFLASILHLPLLLGALALGKAG